MCVCVREKKRERERESVSVCVCEREKEREKTLISSHEKTNPYKSVIQSKIPFSMISHFML